MRTPIFKFSCPPELSSKLNEVAAEVGLDNAAEFFRICGEFFVEERAMPKELQGRRASVRTGRPRTRADQAAHF